MAAIHDFVNYYFIQPLLENDAGYNFVNTPAYGIILAISVFAIYKLLKKLKVPIDSNFFIATFPFVILGGLMRVLRDANIFKSFIFGAPILYFVVFAITFPTLIAAVYSTKYFKTQYWKIMLVTGFVVLIFFASFYRLKNPIPFLQIVSLTAIFVTAGYVTSKFLPELFSKINQYILGGAMFDACSTFIGVAICGYGEKHVLPNFLFGLAGGAWIMLPLKFFVVLLALWMIDKYERDIFFANFIKFAIITVTLGPGVRNTLRIAMGV